MDRFFTAPGGGLFAHDTRTAETRKLGIPLAHVYIQSIALDEENGWIYSQHFTPERLSRFEIETRTTRDLGPLGSGVAMAQGENVILDDDHCAWCGWGMTRAWQDDSGPDAFRLCKFDPRENRVIYYDTGLPRRDGQYGFAHVEGLFNLGNGCLFASGDNGSLYRIDTDTADAHYLGTPIADRPSRLTNLVMHRDGFAYGITGRKGDCQLLRFDPRDGSYELGDPVVSAENEAMYQCHDLSITQDGVIYAGENDNPQRSSYLWEIQGATSS